MVQVEYTYEVLGGLHIAEEGEIEINENGGDFESRDAIDQKISIIHQNLILFNIECI